MIDAYGYVNCREVIHDVLNLVAMTNGVKAVIDMDMYNGGIQSMRIEVESAEAKEEEP